MRYVEWCVGSFGTELIILSIFFGLRIEGDCLFIEKCNIADNMTESELDCEYVFRRM